MRIGSKSLVAVVFLMLCFGFSAAGAEVRAQSSDTGRLYMDEVVDVVQDVEFSAERGFYDTAFQLTLSAPTRAAEIRYTLDGSTPKSNTGIVYRGPLTISGTTVIRAAAFKTNYQNSSVVTKTYIFISDVLRQ
ncbi:MAG: chitobiase/beta-hexosaminidase C-terminal domain-containing protein, partial [Sedimentisphaerales bacterium]